MPMTTFLLSLDDLRMYVVIVDYDKVYTTIHNGL